MTDKPTAEELASAVVAACMPGIPGPRLMTAQIAEALRPGLQAAHAAGRAEGQELLDKAELAIAALEVRVEHWQGVAAQMRAEGLEEAAQHFEQMALNCRKALFHGSKVDDKRAGRAQAYSAAASECRARIAEGGK